MSGVRAAQAVALDHAAPIQDLDAMQDVLYDILATGMDTDQVDAPTEQIERFLFEHARTPKSLEEFRAFFALHGLTVRSVMPPASAAGFALPPLLHVASEPAPAALDLPAEADEALTGQHAFEPGRSRRSRPLATVAIWAGLGLLCAGLAAIVWLGHGILQELRGDLARANQRGDQQEQVISQLEGRAAGIQSSIEANGQLINRMEQKSDLLIDSLVAKPEPPATKRWQPRR